MPHTAVEPFEVRAMMHRADMTGAEYALVEDARGLALVPENVLPARGLRVLAKTSELRGLLARRTKHVERLFRGPYEMTHEGYRLAAQCITEALADE